jgi:hypothetical protein
MVTETPPNAGRYETVSFRIRKIAIDREARQAFGTDRCLPSVNTVGPDDRPVHRP